MDPCLLCSFLSISFFFFFLFFLICLFFLLLCVIHHRADLKLSDKLHTHIPEPAITVQHSSQFWPHFFISDLALPLLFTNSQVIYFCSVSVCPCRFALLYQEMKATQNGTRKWSTFWSHSSVLLQLKKAWKSASQWATAAVTQLL